MSDQLRDVIGNLITRQTGDQAVVAREQNLSGGCINHARCVELVDGRRFFVKSNSDPLPGLFEREAEGLAALAISGHVRVPGLVGTGGGSGDPCIVLEMIETGHRAAGFSESFGRGMAQLHRDSSSDRFGFESDNYIGATHQPNTWTGQWVTFWRDHRLGHQLSLAISNGFGPSIAALGEKMMARLDEWLSGASEPPTLCHGDLWSGNYLVDEKGNAVLIDPAAYYGHREADLSMTMMFGGFDSRFYEAYCEAWPLSEGADERMQIYQLYHHLNHLNLFGAGYLGGCEAILRRFVG